MEKNPRITPTIKGIPKESLLDQQLTIIVENLPENKVVTLELNSGYKNYGKAVARFKPKSNGILDLSQRKPIDGCYTGINPMGLFHYLTPITEKKHNKSVILNKEEGELLFNLSVIIDNKKVTEKNFKRLDGYSMIQREVIDNENLEGVIYKPIDDGIFPGVIVLGGSEGSCPDGVYARLLATKGYVVLALASFNANGLPKELMDVPLEYFINATKWFGDHKNVKDEPMGVIGWSKGGELALLLSSKVSKLQVVVAYVPSSVVFQGIQQSFKKPSSSWRYKNEPLPFITYGIPWKNILRLLTKKPVSFRPTYSKGLEKSKNDQLEKASIPIEDIGGPILLISGKDDQMWNATHMCNMIIERLKNKNYKYEFSHLSYENTGHGITCPYQPVLGREVASSGGRVSFKLGGTAEGHAQADLDSWNHVLKFLDRHLKG